MKTSVKRIGNSLGIRFPKMLTQELNIKEGSDLNIRFFKNKIELTKAENTETLDDLLSQITDINKHSEIETYKAAGNEIC